MTHDPSSHHSFLDPHTALHTALHANNPPRRTPHPHISPSIALQCNKYSRSTLSFNTPPHYKTHHNNTLHIALHAKIAHYMTLCDRPITEPPPNHSSHPPKPPPTNHPTPTHLLTNTPRLQHLKSQPPRHHLSHTLSHHSPHIPTPHLPHTHTHTVLIIPPHTTPPSLSFHARTPHRPHMHTPYAPLTPTPHRGYNDEYGDIPRCKCDMHCGDTYVRLIQCTEGSSVKAQTDFKDHIGVYEHDRIQETMFAPDSTQVGTAKETGLIIGDPI